MSTVLVVDDAAVDRRLACALLEKHPDWTVLSCEDGQAAMESLRTRPVDIVVTDLVMPRMNGLELVEAIKREFPLVPVIITTSRGSEETRSSYWTTTRNSSLRWSVTCRSRCSSWAWGMNRSDCGWGLPCRKRWPTPSITAIWKSVHTCGRATRKPMRPWLPAAATRRPTETAGCA
jgi:CheY-like chemotaxis protein